VVRKFEGRLQNCGWVSCSLCEKEQEVPSVGNTGAISDCSLTVAQMELLSIASCPASKNRPVGQWTV
jgi:hypothetical protein